MDQHKERLQYLGQLIVAAEIAHEKNNHAAVRLIFYIMRCYLLRILPFNLNSLN